MSHRRDPARFAADSGQVDPGAVVIRAVPVQDVLPLRRAVLRAGLPAHESDYEPDRDPATVHLAAVDPSGQVLGCSTWFPQPWRGTPAWRLRGMATAPAARGTGLGGRLLEAGMALAHESGAAVLWCNARTSALGFYRRYGFRTDGDEFVTAHGIPHYVMWRPLADQHAGPHEQPDEGPRTVNAPNPPGPER